MHKMHEIFHSTCTLAKARTCSHWWKTVGVQPLQKTIHFKFKSQDSYESSQVNYSDAEFYIYFIRKMKINFTESKNISAQKYFFLIKNSFDSVESEFLPHPDFPKLRPKLDRSKVSAQVLAQNPTQNDQISNISFQRKRPISKCFLNQLATSTGNKFTWNNWRKSTWNISWNIFSSLATFFWTFSTIQEMIHFRRLYTCYLFQVIHFKHNLTNGWFQTYFL